MIRNTSFNKLIVGLRNYVLIVDFSWAGLRFPKPQGNHGFFRKKVNYDIMYDNNISCLYFKF